MSASGRVPDPGTRSAKTTDSADNQIMNLLADSADWDTPELILVAVLVLILFGARKLPTFARSLGKSMGEFRKAKEQVEQELHRSTERSNKYDEFDKLGVIVFGILLASVLALLAAALFRHAGY